MLVNLAVVLCVLVGFYTKVSTLLYWMFIVSLQTRQLLVYHCGDNMHRLAVFFSLWLPMADVWSVDAWLAPPQADGKAKKKPHMVFNVACLSYT